MGEIGLVCLDAGACVDSGRRQAAGHRWAGMLAAGVHRPWQEAHKSSSLRSRHEVLDQVLVRHSSIGGFG